MPFQVALETFFLLGEGFRFVFGFGLETWACLMTTPTLWDFPKIRVPDCGVLIIGILLF